MDVSAFDQNTLLTWCDDLHQVKSNVSQIQATLNSIISKAPSASDYKELMGLLEQIPESQVVERAKLLLASSQVKVGVRLKQLFDQGQLPLLIALSKINFKSNNADKHVGYLIDYTPGEISRLMGEAGENSTPSSNSEPPKPSQESYPPMLLPITKTPLLIRVLTDKSYRQPSDLLESEWRNLDFSHNAKLAVKGRAVLESYVLELLDQAYPRINEDELYVLGHKIMTDEILAKFALGYNLIDSYKYNLSSDISIQEKLQVFANVFLAYVSGLTMCDYRHSDIKSWLEKLYAPLLTHISSSVSPAPQYVAQAAKKKLELLFKKVTSIYNVDPKLEPYEFIQLESDPFVAQLQINGKSYGVGTSSSSFEDATEKAAAALFNDQTKLRNLMASLVNGYSATIKKTAGVDLPAIPQVTPNMYDSNLLNSNGQQQQQQQQSQSQQPQQQQQQQHQPQLPQQPKQPSQHSLPPQPQQPQLPPQPLSYAPPTVTPYGQPPPGLAPYTQHTVAPYGVPSEQSFRVGVDNTAKNTLYALLGQHHLAPFYRYHRAGLEFQATVLANETILGVGYDSNKKYASQKAAMNALANTKLLAELGLTGQPDTNTSANPETQPSS